MRSRLLIFLAVAVLASACGTDESADQAPGVVDVIATELGGQALNADENNCLAENIVEAVGVDELAAMGITEDGVSTNIELSEEDERMLSESFDDGMAACVDLREVLGRAAEGNGAGSICVLDELSDDQLFIMYGLFTGRSDMTQEQVDDLNATATRAEEICNPGIIDPP